MSQFDRVLQYIVLAVVLVIVVVFYGQNLIERNLIEKSQLLQKVQQLEKVIAEQAKEKK